MIASLGVTMMREHLYPDWEPTNDNADPNSINPSGFNVNNEFLAKQIPFWRAINQKAQASGVPLKFIISIWSPPAWMKTNGSVTNGGSLLPGMYEELAEFCVSFLQMVERECGGSIINIASIEAENAAPMHAHYCAAKAGVVMLTESSAQELGRHGIRVNCVSPGLIWREGIDEAWPEGVERWMKAAPLSRLGTPQDIANACLFLASNAAEWITGANLRVDGGVMTSQIF